MVWECNQCGEIHEGQFDACWNCAVELEEVGKMPHLFPKFLLRFSIRSIGLLTFGVAAICSVFVDNGFSIQCYSIVVYGLAWIIPAGSLGFDLVPNAQGVWSGVKRGSLCCLFSLLLIAFLLP